MKVVLMRRFTGDKSERQWESTKIQFSERKLWEYSTGQRERKAGRAVFERDEVGSDSALQADCHEGRMINVFLRRK